MIEKRGENIHVKSFVDLYLIILGSFEERIMVLDVPK